MTPQQREKLSRWFELQEMLRRLKDEELSLRGELFRELFPEPKEGTNTLDLGDGYELKAQFKMNRKIDKDALEEMHDDLVAAGVPLDELLRYTVSLNTARFRKLTGEEVHLFDQVLTMTPATPSLSIVQTKNKK